MTQIWGYAVKTDTDTHTYLFNNKAKRDESLLEELNTFLDEGDELTAVTDDFDELSKEVIETIEDDGNGIFFVFDDISIS